VSTEGKNRWDSDARDEFRVSPARGTADPLAEYAPFLSDVRRYSSNGFHTLPAPLPASLDLPLTDWLRFDQPGHYKLSIQTSRVTFRSAAAGDTGTLVPLNTNAVEFDVVPADGAWQSRQLRETGAAVPIEWARLRALGTADAARFLADHYRPEMGALDPDVVIGLLGSPNRQAGTDEMFRLLRDPDFGVTPSFLDALALLQLKPAEASWPAIGARSSVLRQSLFEALVGKRGGALATSRQTYIAGIEQTAAVKLSADVIAQLQQVFEALPPLDQNLWLGQRWTQVKDPTWLPMLQRLASRDLDFRNVTRPELSVVNTVSGLAFKRWYELDPVSGREAILKEISKPAPRFNADVLGLLQDRTLPAQEQQIAQHFVSLRTSNGPVMRDGVVDRMRHDSAESNLASLLFRYGDRDVVSEVLPAFNNRIAGGNCFAESNEIAFLMKVDSGSASPFLHAVVSDGATGSNGCSIVLFQQMRLLFASPVFERFAIESLDDTDLMLATEALRYLRDRGSAAAELPIYDRLVRWNAKWRDRASEFVFSGRPAPNDSERSFGMELAQALVRGHGWLADEARIRQILALTLEPNAQGDLTAALDQAKPKPVQIYFMGLGSMFLVAQYQLDSVDDLKNKLSQYPSGTAFIWHDQRSPTYEILDRAVNTEMAQWSSARGIRIDGL
jgi:hypothetical protein